MRSNGRTKTLNYVPTVANVEREHFSLPIAIPLISLLKENVRKFKFTLVVVAIRVFDL